MAAHPEMVVIDPPRRMVKVTIALPYDDWIRLTREARDADRTLASLIRTRLRDWARTHCPVTAS